MSIKVCTLMATILPFVYVHVDRSDPSPHTYSKQERIGASSSAATTHRDFNGKTRFVSTFAVPIDDPDIDEDDDEEEEEEEAEDDDEDDEGKVIEAVPISLMTEMRSSAS
jgi:hypothetical protein